MIDCLFSYLDEAAADAAFPPPPDMDRPPCWTSEGRAVLPCRVWRETDPDGARTYLPGAWRIVSTDARDPALEAIPGFRWAWDREAEVIVSAPDTDDDLDCDPWWMEVES